MTYANQLDIKPSTTRTMLLWVLGLAVAVGAFLSGPVLWPPHSTVPHPTAAQLPFLIGLSIADAATFGVGVVFLVVGWPRIKRLTQLRPWLQCATYLSIGWLLVSWWPHDNLHIHHALDMWPLIGLEYAFHVTLMICGVILAYAAVQLGSAAR